MKVFSFSGAYQALTLALFAISPAHAALDLFPLTQCECSGSSYAPITSGGSAILGNIARSTNPCDGSTAFPDDTGFSSSTSGGSTAGANFINSPQNIVNTIFVAEIDTIAGTGTNSAVSNLISIGSDTVGWQIAGTGGTAASIVSLNGDSTGVSSLFAAANAEPVFVVYGQTADNTFACQATVSNVAGVSCITASTTSTTASDIFLNARIANTAFNLFVRRFAAFSGVSFSDTIEAAVISALNSLGGRVSLPTVDVTAQSGNEDVAKNFDFNSFLTGGLNFGSLDFEFDFGSISDRISGTNQAGGVFTFNPVANSNGAVDIDFTYGIDSPYTCSNSDTFTYTVLPVPDAPVALAVADQVAKAGISINYTLDVATDVDESSAGTVLPLSSGTMSGITLNPASFATIKATGCSGAAITQLAISAGKVSFCLDVAAASIEGTSATMSYTITDGDGLTATGSFKVNGGNPAEANDFSISTNEETAKTLTFNAQMVTKEDEVQNADIDFVIVTLPIHGSIKNGNTVLAVGSSFAFGTTITYTPVTDYFNADSNEEGRDAANTLFDAQCTVTRTDNEVCPDAFTFNARVGGEGGVLDGPASIFVTVIGANDQNPSITTNAESIEVVASNAKNGVISTKLGGISVTNDNGSQLFEVVAVLSTNGDATFLFDVAGVVVSGFDDNSQDCSRDTCTDVTIRGIPSQIAKLLNEKTTVFVPADAEGVVSLQVQIFNTDNLNTVQSSITVSFDVVSDPNSFFDDPKNAAAVAGGGCLVLVGLLGFGIYRSTRASKIERENALIMAESVVVKDRKQDKPDQKRRGKTEVTEDKTKTKKAAPVHDGKKSLKIDANDAIFDWEKHIDEETGEAYFFNPTTGDTSWDPPTVKKYQI